MAIWVLLRPGVSGQTDMGYTMFPEMCGNGAETGLVQLFINKIAGTTPKVLKKGKQKLFAAALFYATVPIAIAIAWLLVHPIAWTAALPIWDFGAWHPSNIRFAVCSL